MKKKTLLFLLLIFITLFAISTGITIAWLTQEQSIENSFQIDSVKGTISATGVDDMTTTINRDNLTFIDYKEDFITNKNELLDKLCSEIKINITATNKFPTRINIKLPDLTVNTGLVYLIIEETQDQSSKDIDIKVVQDTTTNTYTLKYGYNTTTTPTEYFNLVEGLLLTDTNTLFREKIQNANTSKLKYLYENENNLINKDVTIEKHFRILVWGDYESLTQAQKDEFYNNPSNYNMKISVKVIQAIDQYGGTLNYEND